MSAGMLTIDSFGDDQGPISTGSNGPVAVSDAADDRTLTITPIASVPPIDRSVSVSFGVLDVTNGGGEDSQVVVAYTIPALAIPVGATNVQFFLTIVQSDGNPTAVALGGVATGNFNIPANTLNDTVLFPVGGVAFGPGSLTLTFDGATGWDLTADSFGVQWTDPRTGIPEPGSMILLGMGGIAIGILRRRTA